MCRKVQQSPLLLRDDHFSTFLSIKYCYGSCPAALHHSISALATALWLQCISSGDSPVALLYQLQQLCGCSGSDLLPREKPSEHLESWRTQVYYTSGLRGDHSLESEPQRRVSQGFYGLVLLGPCLADWSEVRQGSRCGSKFTEADVWGRGGWGSWLDFA